MNLRTRLMVMSALAVAIAVGISSGFVYVTLRQQIIGDVDVQLAKQASRIAIFAPAHLSSSPTNVVHRSFGGANTYVQFVRTNGSVVRLSASSVTLPLTKRDRTALRSPTQSFFSNLVLNGVELRVITVSVSGVGILQIARSIQTEEQTLHHLAILLISVSLGGIVLAIGIGWIVARMALGPLRGLTDMARSVAKSRDLANRIDVSGNDELGELAVSFNTMLGALEQSVALQRQFIGDVSHELRTPLTSLRTNAEMLFVEGISGDERAGIQRDILLQIEEMTLLVTTLIELARGEERDTGWENAQLDLLVDQAVTRTKRHWPSITFSVNTFPCVIHCVPDRVVRAIGNLLENAAKWSSPGDTVEVSLSHIDPDVTEQALTIDTGAEVGSQVQRGVGQMVSRTRNTIFRRRQRRANRRIQTTQSKIDPNRQDIAFVEIKVRDFGPGISDKDLPFIFDRFYRADNARKLPGSGLGLAIVRQVAESHGGRIFVDSGEAGGTLVRLSLPLLPTGLWRIASDGVNRGQGGPFESGFNKERGAT